MKRIIHPMTKKTPKQQSSTIALNRKVKHDYFIEEKFEAGLVLLGWEVKSLRESKVNLTDTYVFVRDGEAWLNRHKHHTTFVSLYSLCY